MSSCEPIGRIHTPFQEKFGIPRQAGLVEEATGFVELLPPYNDGSALRGLETFSHVWLIWWANEIKSDHWKPTVRPPRLGGNKRLGVFATRSVFRPNNIGQSLVKLEKIVIEKSRCGLEVSGVDILDGTPLLDIKPYLPWADQLNATAGFAADRPEEKLAVRIAEEAHAQFELIKSRDLKTASLIKRVIAHDPRPAFHGRDRHYGMRIANIDVKFYVSGMEAWIVSCEKG